MPKPMGSYMEIDNQPGLFSLPTPNVLGGWEPFPVPPDITREGVYIGTSGYYYQDWLGKFNPPKVPQKHLRFLTDEQREEQNRFLFYQKYFSFIEINHTFYKEPQINTFIEIEKKSKKETQFTIKVHRNISHSTVFNRAKAVDLMKRHIHAVSPLAETGRFHSFLIQLENHNDRSMEKFDYLLAIAEVAIKNRMDVHIEFRHKSWHQPYILKTMKDHGVGICNTEIPGVHQAYPLKAYATTDKGYIRYSGQNTKNWYPEKKLEISKERMKQRNHRYNYLYTEKEIQQRVNDQRLLLQKTNTLAIAYNNHFNSQAVKNAIDNINQLKRKLEAPHKDA